MPTPANELCFEKKEIRIIKKFRKPIPREKVDKQRGEKYGFLFDYSLIELDSKTHKTYHLSNKGKMYLAHQKKSSKQYHLSIRLSVTAIVISILALIVTFLANFADIKDSVSDIIDFMEPYLLK